MNVAFFGTSDRSTPILNALHDDPDLDLVLCVTKIDTKTGRKQETRETEVKKWANKVGVNVLTTSSLKKDASLVIEKLIEYKVELGIVADFSFIIPENIINTLKYGLINIHFSLLPAWRGASPVQFSILKGDEITGITYQLVHPQMDKGDVLHQIGYKTTGKETSGELYNHLFPIAADNLTKVIKGYLDGTIIPKPQEEEKATYTFSPSHPQNTFIFKEDAQIDWKKSPIEIDRMIRAFNPWPIAWTTLGDVRENAGKSRGEGADKRVKIYQSEIVNGLLKINSIQVEGKNPTDWSSFVNGYLK